MAKPLAEVCTEWRLEKMAKKKMRLPKNRQAEIEQEPPTIEQPEQETKAELVLSEQDSDSLPIHENIPDDWRKGALLNVRNYGPEYIVTLYPEEYDPRSPERSLHFRNPAETQNFVSAWYARESGGRPW